MIASRTDRPRALQHETVRFKSLGPAAADRVTGRVVYRRGRGERRIFKPGRAECGVVFARPFRRRRAHVSDRGSVRWLPDGQLEFLRRLDHQVKIRGHRIEVGEVENHLRRLEAVKDALLCPSNGKDRTDHLVAYVVPEAEQADAVFSREREQVAFWRTELARHIARLYAASGVCSFARLPAERQRQSGCRPIAVAREGRRICGRASRNERERQLQDVWAEVLGNGKPGMNEPFFEIGGHSLNAMLLTAKVQQKLGVKLGLQDVFQYPTIRLQAERIGELQMGRRLEDSMCDAKERNVQERDLQERNAQDEAVREGKVLEKGDHYAAIPRAPQQQMYPASFAQRRLYVIHQDEHAKTSYNMPLAFKIRGELDLYKLEQSFLTLLERHEALRTSFHHDGNDVWMRVHPLAELQWRLDVSEEDGKADVNDTSTQADAAARWIASCIQPFALNNAPLIRAFVRKWSAQEYGLLIDTHHIVSDGISTSILLDELFKIYAGKTLPPLAVQYKDYAVWERSARDRAEYQQAKTYWNELFTGEVPDAEWPTDFARPQVRRYEGAQCTHTIRRNLFENITRVAADHGITPYMLLISAYHILSDEIFRARRRRDGSADCGSGACGILRTSSACLSKRCRCARNLKLISRWRKYLSHVRKRVLDGRDHALYPLEELLDDLNLPYGGGRSPLFIVCSFCKIWSGQG